MRSKILDNVRENIKDLHELGLVDTVTMREIDSLCLPKIKKMSSAKIKKIRKKEMVSQPVFAHFLNVSPSTVKQWESGEKSPSGPALMLLNVVDQKGLYLLDQ